MPAAGAHLRVEKDAAEWFLILGGLDVRGGLQRSVAIGPYTGCMGVLSSSGASTCFLAFQGTLQSCPLFHPRCMALQGAQVVWEMYRDAMLDAGFEPDTPLFVATGLLSCERAGEAWGPRCTCHGAHDLRSCTPAHSSCYCNSSAMHLLLITPRVTPTCTSPSPSKRPALTCTTPFQPPFRRRRAARLQVGRLAADQQPAVQRGAVQGAVRAAL